MATTTKPAPKEKTASAVPASLIWFDIPADNMDRARDFYHNLFGWKIEPFAGVAGYLHINTGGADASPDGGLLPRKDPDHPVTIYISVDSVSRASAKVEQLGGKICMQKTAVPQMGYFAICQDTENNTFALWERNDKAK